MPTSILTENTFRCNVCFEDFTDPRNLDCGHTFCLKCLENIPISRKKLSCPSCRQVTYLGPCSSVADLGTPFVMRNLQQSLKELETHMAEVKCEGCSFLINEDGFYCHICKVVICEECLDKHKGKGHRGDTLRDLSFCETHIRHINDAKCVDCSKYICEMCTFGSHADHSILSMDELITKTLADIEPVLETCDHFTYDTIELKKIRDEMEKSNFPDNAIKIKEIFNNAIDTVDQLILVHKQDFSSLKTSVDTLLSDIKANESCLRLLHEFKGNNLRSVQTIQKVEAALRSFRDIPPAANFFRPVCSRDIGEVVKCVKSAIEGLSLEIIQYNVTLRSQNRKEKRKADPGNSESDVTIQKKQKCETLEPIVKTTEAVDLGIVGKDEDTESECDDLDNDFELTETPECNDEFISLGKALVMGVCFHYKKQQIVLRTNDPERAITVYDFEGDIVSTIPVNSCTKPILITENIDRHWGVCVDLKRNLYACAILIGSPVFPGIVQLSPALDADVIKSDILSMEHCVLGSQSDLPLNTNFDLTYSEKMDCYISMFCTGLVVFMKARTGELVRKFILHSSNVDPSVKWESPTIDVWMSEDKIETLCVTDYPQKNDRNVVLQITMDGDAVCKNKYVINRKINALTDNVVTLYNDTDYFYKLFNKVDGGHRATVSFPADGKDGGNRNVLYIYCRSGKQKTDWTLCET